MYASKKILDDKEFIDILDEIYYEPVNVCGMEMSQGDVLYKCDPIAFREAKNDYEDSDSNPWVCEVCQTEHEEHEHADNCCKIDHLISMLEVLGFVGTDESLAESLLTYGFVYRERDGYTLLCGNPNCLDEVTDTDSIQFQSEWIDKTDIQDVVDNQDKGFFDFIGIDKSEYNLSEVRLVNAISDVLSYCSCWLIEYFNYDLTIDDVIGSLQAEIDSINAANAENKRIASND